MNTGTILEVCQSHGDFRLHEGYSEPGYDSKKGTVATGNWNSLSKRRRRWPKELPEWLDVKEGRDAIEEYTDDTMPRIAAILEKLDVEIEWEDEWVECDSCYKIVRTSPDSYSWLPSYWNGEGEVLCFECIQEDPSDYIEHLKGNPNAALTLDIDLEDHGYVRLDEETEYASGFHPGQTDDPHEIAKELDAQGVSDYIFEITGTGQFDTHFVVWVHKENSGEK